VRKLTLLGAIIVLLALPGRALGEGGTWEAQYISESSYLTLESGETATSYFTARNIGTGTWDPSFVHLGTTNPRERASSLYDASDWFAPTRPTVLDQASVAPGQDGTFTFKVRAPEVTAATVTDEYFAPVADAPTPAPAWMENDASGWPPNGVFLRYTIIPRQPPTARITSSPDRVGQGQPIDVAADASDNVHIARVAFGVDGHDTVSDTTRPYSATLASDGLTVGRHTIEARAYDGVGQQAIATTSVDVLDSSAGVANGNPTVRSARIAGGFGKKARSRLTVGYGKGALLRGRLVTPQGGPIGGATLLVSSRVLAGNRGFRDITGAKVVTGADGGFVYRVPKGASRQVRIAYRAYSHDTAFAAQRLFSLRTRAGVRLSVSPSRVRNGGRVRFRGRLRGGPKPRAGVLVVLQAREGGHWRSFRTVRTTRKGGRFSTRYRFTRTGRPTTFRFRALVRKQIGYAYSTGTSPSRRVRVAP
jgi:Bacterial Ig domain